MAAKRGKSQARRNSGGNSSGMPGWAWLVIGLALGVGVFLLAPKFFGTGEGFFRATPDTGAQPPALDGTSDGEPIVGDSDTPATTAEPAPKTQDYDFYTLLSGEETALSDAELAARARAEEAARQTAETPTPPANPDAADTVPPAIDTPKPPAPTPANTTAAANDPVQPPAPKPTTDAAAGDDARYLLQAGAFAASGDAEALKAKIAFLGLSARVESAQIKDKTVYRVRMGPYGTATELAEAKRKLSGGGLPAMAIKAK
ncbi:MAG: SPOR domain-containing protein [Xanthomonadales bacterium]|nr:SPOR domain-containing protein [Xanthomonadales bacterium]